MRSLTSRKTPRPGLGLLGRAWRFFNDPEAPRPVRLLLLAALLYVVLPLDAIPDVAPVVGWLDDIGFAGLALTLFSASLGRYEAARAVRVEE